MKEEIIFESLRYQVKDEFLSYVVGGFYENPPSGTRYLIEDLGTWFPTCTNYVLIYRRWERYNSRKQNGM